MFEYKLEFFVWYLVCVLRVFIDLEEITRHIQGHLSIYKQQYTQSRYILVSGIK